MMFKKILWGAFFIFGIFCSVGQAASSVNMFLN